MKKFKDYEVALAFIVLAVCIVSILVFFVIYGKKEYSMKHTKKPKNLNFTFEEPKDYAEDSTLCDRKRVYYNALYNYK